MERLHAKTNTHHIQVKSRLGGEKRNPTPISYKLQSIPPNPFERAGLFHSIFLPFPDVRNSKGFTAFFLRKSQKVRKSVRSSVP